MTRAEAVAEAHKRWGPEATALALRIEKRRGRIYLRYRVGVPDRYGRLDRVFNGDGDSYEAAFLDADRRAE